MGRVYESIDESTREWMLGQPMFFVGTAPADLDGHVNISPKGSIKTFSVIDEHTVAHVDLVGSGIETTAHLQENGRIVVMFCAFDGPPRIVRLHGRGRVCREGSSEFGQLLTLFSLDPKTRAIARSIIVVEVTRVADSCGFVVPRLSHVGDRDQLIRWSENKRRQHGSAWKSDYLTANNTVSIDGLPGLEPEHNLDDSDVSALSSNGRAL